MNLEQGAVITKPGNSIENKTGNWRTRMPVVNHDTCTRCGICWQFCPDMCFSFVKDNSKYKKKITINYNFCKGCLICAKECPVNAIKVKELG